MSKQTTMLNTYHTCISDIKRSSISSVILRTNYAKLAHAVKQLFPAILIEFISIKEPPQRLFDDVNTNKYLLKHLSADELIFISNTVEYSHFDIPLIYKLLRYLKKIPPPTQGWNHFNAPCQTEITPGDDLQRIRIFRNETLHRGNVTDTELSEFITHFKDIAGRLETYLGKQTGEFMDKFVHLETCSMDEEMINKYCRRLDWVEKRDEDCEETFDLAGEKIRTLEKKSK